MNNDKPGILHLQDSTDSEVQTQNLKRGNTELAEQIQLLKEALKNITAMPAPGIKPIKQVELASKWQPLVPDEYQGDICPIPPREVTMKFKESRKSNATSVTTDALLRTKKMKKSKIHDELKKRSLSTNRLKDVLIKRLVDAIKTESNSQQIENSDKDFRKILV